MTMHQGKFKFKVELSPKTGAGYVIIKGKRYAIKQAMIGANGTHDLCTVKQGDGEIALRSKFNLKPGDEIVYNFKNDVLGIEFFEVPPPPFDGKFTFMEIEDNMIPMINTLTKFFMGSKEKNYDAYLGKDYGRRN